jgi:hypothetical protein
LTYGGWGLHDFHITDEGLTEIGPDEYRRFSGETTA